MRHLIILLFISLAVANVLPAQTFTDWLTPYEKSNGTETATVAQCKMFYENLFAKFPDKVSFSYSSDPEFMFVIVRNRINPIENLTEKSNLVRIFINNAIHPGEPDGVDACMMLVRDICLNKFNLPNEVELNIIPIYNISGAKRRTSTSRANQNGPEEYGFRANGMNLDLNRDFIKQDAPETAAFKKVFFYNGNSPEIFIETHVSDGADYQPILTLLPTQHNQLGGSVGQFQHDELVPALYSDMKEKGYDLVPYVNHSSETPDSGWVEFFDSPRFSSGFTSMFHSLSILTETHMLKPYIQRVPATLEFLKSAISYAANHFQIIKENKRADENSFAKMKTIPVAWKVDSSKYALINFNGYSAGHKPSAISGRQRLYYDHSKPYCNKVKHYDEYVPTNLVEMPDAYIIPGCYKNVIEKILSQASQPNGFSAVTRILRDTLLELDVYHIEKYKTVSQPYEGHYLHYETRVCLYERQKLVEAGSYIISTHNNYSKFLASVLEPTAPDSYFNWNLFDGILQQKEGYSDYVFEDMAAEYLKQHPELRKELEELKAKDTAFEKDGRSQLDWVYKHSPYFETTVNEYPIYKWYFPVNSTTR